MNNTIIATSIAVTIALIIVIASFFFGLNIFTLFSSATPSTVKTEAVVNKPSVNKTSGTPATISTIKKLSITDAVVGTGTVAKVGDTVSVDYIGKLTNGKVFDASSKHGGKPFTFILGVGQVIKGWDEGVAGMKVGGTRILAIPASLGYGSRAIGSIPANSALIFEVKLLNVTAPKK